MRWEVIFVLITSVFVLHRRFIHPSHSRPEMHLCGHLCCFFMAGCWTLSDTVIGSSERVAISIDDEPTHFLVNDVNFDVIHQGYKSACVYRPLV